MLKITITENSIFDESLNTEVEVTITKVVKFLGIRLYKKVGTYNYEFTELTEKQVGFKTH